MEKPSAEEEIDRLARSMFWRKVERARKADPVQKLLDGPRLFDFACRIMKDGIRAQFPEATEEEVAKICSERIALSRRIENRGIYTPIKSSIEESQDGVEPEFAMNHEQGQP